MRWLLLLVAFSGCTAKTYSDRENYRGDTQSTYDVWDYEIVSAYEVAGQRFRVAVVNERHFVDSEPSTQGADGLDEATRKSIPVGSTKQMALRELQFASIKASPVTVRPLKNSDGIIVKITHVKSCPVTTSEREQTSIVGDSSKGIITIPKLKTVTLREFSAPACADVSDQVRPVVAAAPPPSKEVIEALAATSKEAAQADYQKRLNARYEELRRDYEKRSRAVVTEGTSDVEKPFCPGLAGKMQAAGITEIALDRREASRTDGKGYTEIRYESSATLMPMKSKFDDGDLSTAARLIRSLKSDARGCVTVELTNKENGLSAEDLRKIAKELETVVHRHQNSALYEQALKEIGPEK